ncbi:MAG: low specificity L-threonine aldolase [Oscillospiraceae bacterium]|nr:low specificity L-threonine aldolase [Oscillospiraceae bacterium]
MIRFESDYLEGAHPQVLEALVASNLEQHPGYGEDERCETARALIRGLCAAPEAAVHFLVGGTQVNCTVISAALRPHQGVISADSGHIAVHETGAVEHGGHKVLCAPAVNGKLLPEDIARLVDTHWADVTHEHQVQPGMVYISNPTEMGTVYTRAELSALAQVCGRCGLPLYMDGARLGCALVSEECDYDLPFLYQCCDAFTIGGTKLGALFGEALVIRNRELNRDFRYFIKQGGGMLAKGRLLGVQFEALLKDGLYFDIARKENELAMRIRRQLEALGYSFDIVSPTNQQFPILPNTLLEKLGKKYSFSMIAPGTSESCIRFCTGWATREEDVEALLTDLRALS